MNDKDKKIKKYLNEMLLCICIYVINKKIMIKKYQMTVIKNV